MIIDWPEEAIDNPNAFMERIISAVNAMPGSKVEIWHEHRFAPSFIPTTLAGMFRESLPQQILGFWRAKFTTECSKHLDLIEASLPRADGARHCRTHRPLGLPHPYTEEKTRWPATS